MSGRDFANVGVKNPKSAGEGSRVDEKRKIRRQRVLKRGTIEFGGSVIDCMVRNLSNTGAALNVVTPVGIPGHFELVIPADHLRFSCRVVWCKASVIGVRFD
jgi:PilZ domain-containing protein